MEWLRQLAEEHGLFDENLTMDELIDKLRERGIIEEIDGVPTLTTRGVQRIRQDALREIFTSLRKGNVGAHETPQTGRGVERLSETKKWSVGDAPTAIDLTATLTNAFKRAGIDEFNLAEEDLEVYETEHTTSCATVLMLDISHSMVLYGEDRITPAKQVALADDSEDLAVAVHNRHRADAAVAQLAGDLVDRPGERRLEPGEMSPAFVGVDVVHEGEGVLVVPLFVLQREVDVDLVGPDKPCAAVQHADPGPHEQPLVDAVESLDIGITTIAQCIPVVP